MKYKRRNRSHPSYKIWAQKEFLREFKKLRSAEFQHGLWWGAYAQCIEPWEPWAAEAMRNPRLFLWCYIQIRRKARRESKRRTKNKRGTKTFLSSKIRSRLARSIKEGKGMKSGKSRDILGCDWGFLRQHIESKFQPGMTWANYGYHGWHIDHIRPLALFDMADPAQVKEAWNWRNLQPLWAHQNYDKLARLDYDLQVPATALVGSTGHPVAS